MHSHVFGYLKHFETSLLNVALGAHCFVVWRLLQPRFREWRCVSPVSPARTLFDLDNRAAGGCSALSRRDLYGNLQ